MSSLVWDHFTKFVDDKAVKFERAFASFEYYDSSYRSELVRNGDGVLDDNNWATVKRISLFLKEFYDMTVNVSSTSYVTANSFLDSISDVYGTLIEWQESDDVDLKSMAMKMKAKFDKSFLTPKIMQTLICAQDWLNGKARGDSEQLEDNLDELDLAKITLEPIRETDAGSDTDFDSNSEQRVILIDYFHFSGLLFSEHGHLKLEAFTDADWARSPDDRRSTSAYCTFVESNGRIAIVRREMSILIL
ncbi:Uncharacterized protein TCM_028997 [Theobroma cacao]|uniref:hAT-like transposase RNase-H fold domain-containing protein n=1 Tax=Theobroma cacao TaxID=3641 RepID=A0A061GD23_THECC|nr:Uncharacterized protein TCM_028997 [Theobroma cacao]